MNKTLNQAAELLHGDRQEDYGTPERSLARVSELWSVTLGFPVSPRQVALCMAQLKMARLISNPNHIDSWVDLAGYAGLGGDLPKERNLDKCRDCDLDAVIYWANPAYRWCRDHQPPADWQEGDA